MTTQLHIWAHVDAYVASDVQRYLSGKWRPLKLELYPEKHREPVAVYNRTLPVAIQMIHHPTGCNKAEKRQCKTNGKIMLESCAGVLRDAVMLMARRGKFRHGDKIE